MPRVPGLDTLPPEARRWLQTQWRRHTGWGDNQRLAEELSQRLTQEGRTETYSPSTLWRWAQVDRRQAEAITHAAELRLAVIAGLPQDQPELADRAGAYLEGRIVEAIEDIDALEDLDPIARLEALIKAQQANTGRRRIDTERERAELARQRWEAEQAIRAEAKTQAAESMAHAAARQGVSAEGIEALRLAILGGL